MKAHHFVQNRVLNVILILSLLLPAIGVEIARPGEVARAAAATPRPSPSAPTVPGTRGTGRSDW